MKVTVRYFASIRETIGVDAETLETAVSTLGGLRDELIVRGSLYAQALGRDRVVRAAVDQVMQQESCVLRPGCEVAFFPPVTGG